MCNIPMRNYLILRLKFLWAEMKRDNIREKIFDDFLQNILDGKLWVNAKI